MQEACTCERVVRAGGLYIGAVGFHVQGGCTCEGSTCEGCTCGRVVRARVVRAGGLYVQEGCTCSWVPRTGGL